MDFYSIYQKISIFIIHLYLFFSDIYLTIFNSTLTSILVHLSPFYLSIDLFLNKFHVDYLLSKQSLNHRPLIYLLFIYCLSIYLSKIYLSTLLTPFSSSIYLSRKNLSNPNLFFRLFISTFNLKYKYYPNCSFIYLSILTLYSSLSVVTQDLNIYLISLGNTSIYLSIFNLIYLSIFYCRERTSDYLFRPIYLSISPIHLFRFYLKSIYLSIKNLESYSLYLSIYLSIFMKVSSGQLYPYLSIYLSIYLYN
ncbi:unnamed protein product [Acanthosepion pharaonis]|uniref:Uncharacterized protein n=1 Tax=Acanthosepion pharaonis TaxID=158019 RepID=A0A812CG91_ACAPH|nr:unnamed protein product [Sepia pharaonis]